MGNVYKDHQDDVITDMVNDAIGKLKSGTGKPLPGGSHGRANLGATNRGVIPPHPVGGLARIKTVKESTQRIHIPSPA